MSKAGKGKNRESKHIGKKRSKASTVRKVQNREPKHIKEKESKASKFARKDFTTKEREGMFLDWCRVRSVRRVATKWDLAYSTVHRIKKQDDWDSGLDAMLEQARTKTIKKGASAFARRLKITQGIHSKLAKRIASVPAEALEPSIRDYVSMSRYLDEIEGDVPVASKQEIVIEVIQRIEQDATGISARNIIGNTLAGYDILDKRAVDKISEIWACSLRSQN